MEVTEVEAESEEKENLTTWTPFLIKSLEGACP